jgi:aminoglycoside phosphotransferase
MIAARHGTTNTVRVDDRGRRVIKSYRRGPAVLWRSPERERAALTAAGATGLVPQLISAGDNCLVLELLAGQPFPQAVEVGDPLALARVAGSALRAVHQCVSAPAADASLASLRLPEHDVNTAWANVVGSLIERLIAVLRDAVPSFAQPLRGVARLVPTLLRELPEPILALVHGDFGGANVLVEPTGVLDWEWAHLGDPEYDLARHVWLREVGRDHRLYAGRKGLAAFFDGYGHTPDRAQLDLKIKIYGIVLALGHAVADVHRGQTPAAQIQWLTVLSAGDRS